MARTKAASPRVGSRAPDPTVRTLDDEEVRLSSFWRDRPAVTVFLRHYG